MKTYKNKNKNKNKNYYKKNYSKKHKLKTKKYNGGGSVADYFKIENVRKRKETKSKQSSERRRKQLSSERRRKSIEDKILAREKSSDNKQRKKDKLSQAFLNDECTICLDDLDDYKNKNKIEKCLSCLDIKNKKLYFTGCEHTFHGRCLDKWLEQNRECPLCRSYIHELALTEH